MISSDAIPQFSDLAASTLIIGSEGDWLAMAELYRQSVHASDWWENDREKPLTVREVRDLHYFAGHTPVGDTKVVCIFQADLLKAEAANALLKILEEPPTYLKLVLFSESQHLLPTLLSRLRVISLQKTALSESEFSKWQIALEKFNLADPHDRERVSKLLYLLPLMHSGIQQNMVREAFSSDK